MFIRILCTCHLYTTPLPHKDPDHPIHTAQFPDASRGVGPAGRRATSLPRMTSARPHGQRPSHHAFTDSPQPQACLLGGALVTLWVDYAGPGVCCFSSAFFFKYFFLTLHPQSVPWETLPRANCPRKHSFEVHWATPPAQ